MVALLDWFQQAQGWRFDANDAVAVALAPGGQLRAMLRFMPDGAAVLIDRATGRYAIWRPEDDPCLGDLRHTMTKWFYNEPLVLNPALVPTDLGDAIDMLTDENGVPEWVEVYDPEHRWTESLIVAYLDHHLSPLGLRVKNLQWETVNGAWVQTYFAGAMA